ncbi:MAG: ABC transporter ATP-binding protein [Planctomycetota bacterium]|jgi:ABC-2 type transport system ATP-binding protein
MTTDISAGPAIELRELRKEFPKGKNGVVAVDCLSLTVQRGEVFGLLGPNGAGKTTTVEICEGLQKQTSGEVFVLGQSWRDGGGESVRQRIGVSLQETKFFEKQTVREILTLFRSFFDTGRTVDEAIELVSLEDKADSRTMHLSGGQRQRLAVATALVSTPELLFLDEPTTGLDPQSRRQLWEVVRGFHAGGGTVLLTTHYMEEAEQLCDRVGIMHKGRLIALDTPRNLVASLDGGHVIEIESPGIGSQITDTDLDGLPSVRRYKLAANLVSLTVDAPHKAVPAALEWLEQRNIELAGLATRHTSLEDVFVHLTGHHLEEADE